MKRFLARIAPEVSRIEVLRLEPDDILVVTARDLIDHQQAERLHRGFAEKFPGRKVLVLCENMTLSTMRETTTCSNDSYICRAPAR